MLLPATPDCMVSLATVCLQHALLCEGTHTAHMAHMMWAALLSSTVATQHRFAADFCRTAVIFCHLAMTVATQRFLL